MCGPSSEAKKINQSIQAFSNKVTDEAGTIFGEANQVFNDIKNAMTGIVKGGPSQMGYGAAELSAKNAAAVQAGATEARNLKAATGSAIAAIGGGNQVAPSGSTQQMIFDANARAAADTAAELNRIQTQGFETGRENFFKAANTELEAPKVLTVADQANRTAMEGEKQAQQSQQQLDEASGWWKPLVMKGVTGLISAATGGIGGGIGKAIGGKISGGSTGAGWTAGNIGATEDDFLNQQNG